jgi:predicted Zn-dependent peptidase
LFYDKTVLPNGITVLSETMTTVRSVAIGIWLTVGSRDEAPADAGMSHFMEHMMFKGTPTRTAAEISATFDRLGAELNAFTGKESTCFYARVLDEHVDVALEVLSDMVVNSELADDAIKYEREVVIEEIARHEDTPEDQIGDVFVSALWPSHPLGLPVLGSRGTVGNFDNTQSRNFHDRHYRTCSTVVAAAGNVDHADLVALVEKHLTMQEGSCDTRPLSDAHVETRLQVLTRDTEQAHIAWGVNALKATDDDRFVLSIMDVVLGGGMSSRLFQEIREKKGLAYAVGSYHQLFEDAGLFGVYAGTRPNNAEEVIRLVKQQVDSVRTEGITADELSLAKDALKGSLVLSLESTRMRMTRLAKSEITHGEILSLDELVERIDKVTLGDVKELAGRLFGGPEVLAVIGPFTVDDLAHLVE